MQNTSHKQKGTKCPVCGEKSTVILWSTESQQAAGHFLLKNRNSTKYAQLVAHIEQLWQGTTSDILKCSDCGFCFCDPYVAGDGTFYHLAFGDKPGYPQWKWDFQITYEHLIGKPNQSLRLLEIGAGNGAFIRKVIAEITPKENILCTEFSEHGRSAIEAMGVQCAPIDFQDLSDANFQNSFDAICMFQVLEHMDHLDGHFEKLAWLAKPGADLFITVPNHLRTEFNELHGGLLDMPPNHIGRWNKKCFEVIGEKYGFKVTDFKTETASLKASLITFSHYRFLRRSQTPGSFANRISGISNRRARQICQAFSVAMTSIPLLPLVFRNKSKLGMSSWVHFVKNPD